MKLLAIAATGLASVPCVYLAGPLRRRPEHLEMLPWRLLFPDGVVPITAEVLLITSGDAVSDGVAIPAKSESSEPWLNSATSALFSTITSGDSPLSSSAEGFFQCPTGWATVIVFVRSRVCWPHGNKMGMSELSLISGLLVKTGIDSGNPSESWHCLLHYERIENNIYIC